MCTHRVHNPFIIVFIDIYDIIMMVMITILKFSLTRWSNLMYCFDVLFKIDRYGYMVLKRKAIKHFMKAKVSQPSNRSTVKPGEDAMRAKKRNI